MTDAVAEERKTMIAKHRMALRRYGEPEEVAHVTLPLVLPAATPHRGGDPGRWRADDPQRLTPSDPR